MSRDTSGSHIYQRRDTTKVAFMFSYELLTVVYVAALTAFAPLTHARPRQVWRVAGAAAGLVALILILTAWIPASGRAWFGHLYLVSAYWLPALLVSDASNRKLEAWLARIDALVWRRTVRCPSPVVTLLDASYMGCYVLVPIAFVGVWLRDDLGAINRFWVAVLGAGFACYGSLPWLVSDPPRLREPSAAAGANAIRRLNLFVLGRVSHGLNTFPSGHVAVSLAAALMVAAESPAAGGVLIAIAMGIAAGAVLGRYHYLVDVLLGMLVGAAAALIAMRA